MKRTLMRLYGRTIGPLFKTVSADAQYASVEELRKANRALQGLLEGVALSIKDRIRAETPENLVLEGYKIYSQTDEDGIIAAIFRRILPSGRTFIEIGCSDGLQNNTHALALAGWRGAWVDGSADDISFIRSLVGINKDLILKQSFVTREGVAQLMTCLARQLGAAVIDFLSLDIDGNDYYVMESILDVTRPRVVCVEYNSKFPHPLEIIIRYDPKHVWQKDDYQGASLASWVKLFSQYGYTLITCNISGVNAFFVNNDEAKAFTIYSPRALYQPGRYYLSSTPLAHPPTLKFLAEILKQKSHE
jgi:hypothetical protein